MQKNRANKGFSASNIVGKGNDMARRRYQKGTVYPHNGGYRGRYVESVLLEDGTEKRIRRNVDLGKQPTAKMAQRALDPFLEKINAPSYQPLRQSNWARFSDQWARTMLKNYSPSNQASIKSTLKALAWFDRIQLHELDNFYIQQFIAQSQSSAKTIKNQIAHMRKMWKSAKAWKYVQHYPFDREDLVLPPIETQEQPVYSPAQVRQIMLAAKPPYDDVVWVFAETGIRRGELCGLNVGDVNLEERYITINRSRWSKHLTRPKSKKQRMFAISDLLAERLRQYMDGRGKDEPLFLSPEGCRLHPENLAKRVLKPILKRLGLDGACHAFRHGNITAMSSERVSPAIMQQRVGHAHFDTTMIYMHVVSEEARAAANALGRLYGVDLASMETKGKQ